MGTRQRLILLGAGGQGRVVADIALHTGLYREIGFLDDDPGVADTGLPFPLLGSFPSTANGLARRILRLRSGTTLSVRRCRIG